MASGGFHIVSDTLVLVIMVIILPGVIILRVVFFGAFVVFPVFISCVSILTPDIDIANNICPSVRLSVCPSVTFRYCMTTA